MLFEITHSSSSVDKTLLINTTYKRLISNVLSYTEPYFYYDGSK